jgi:hypothetical protein
MTGSTRVFNYTTDSGVVHSVVINEANGKAIIELGVRELFLTGHTPSPRLPVGLKMRYVVATDTATPLIKRRFWVGDLGGFAELKRVGGTFYTRFGQPNQQRWRVTHYGPEVVQYLPTTDTGQDDGTPGLT